MDENPRYRNPKDLDDRKVLGIVLSPCEFTWNTSKVTCKKRYSTALHQKSVTCDQENIIKKDNLPQKNNVHESIMLSRNSKPRHALRRLTRTSK